MIKWKVYREKSRLLGKDFFFFLPQNRRMFLNEVAEVDYCPHGQFHCGTRQDTSFRSQDQEIPAEQLSVTQWGGSADFRTSL